MNEVNAAEQEGQGEGGGGGGQRFRVRVNTALMKIYREKRFARFFLHLMYYAVYMLLYLRTRNDKTYATMEDVFRIR